MRLGQHDPENRGDHHHVSARQRHVGKPAESSLGQEQLHEDQTGDHMQHRHDPHQHHLQREPFRESGLQEDQRRSAADSDKGGRRSQLDIDKPRNAVQPVEIQPRLEGPALPEQKRQRDQAA